MDTDRDAPLTNPQDVLALLREEQHRARRAFDVDPGRLYLAWGSAWVVGFTGYALAGGQDPVVDVPGWLPGLVLFAGLAVAGVFTGAHVASTQRGVSGDGGLPSVLYGLSWLVGFGAAALLVHGTASALDDPAVPGLLWPAASALVVGMIYLGGGALWRDVVQFGLGTWTACVGGAALFAGTPGQSWVMAIAGGGGFLVAAALDGRRRRRGAGALAAGVPA